MLTVEGGASPGSIEWQQLSGPEVSYTTDANSLTFLAPHVSEQQKIEFQARFMGASGIAQEFKAAVEIMPPLVKLAEYQKLVSADMDSDGLDDLVVSEGAAVAWHRNLGGGLFGRLREIHAFSAPVAHLELVDADADDDIDIIAFNETEYTLVENNQGQNWNSVYVLSQGWDSADWVNSSSTSLCLYNTRTTQRALAGDVNGDGVADLVWSAECADQQQGLNVNALFYAEGQSQFSYAEPKVIATFHIGGFTFNERVGAIKALDLDSDGQDELVISVSTRGAGSGSFAELLFDVNLEPITRYPMLSDYFDYHDYSRGYIDEQGHEIQAVSYVDLNNDGLLDVLTNGVSFWEGSSMLFQYSRSQTQKGVFSEPQQISPDGQPYLFSKVLDIDGDGKQDLIDYRKEYRDGSYFYNEISWMRHEQNGFAEPELLIKREQSDIVQIIPGSFGDLEGMDFLLILSDASVRVIEN